MKPDQINWVKNLDPQGLDGTIQGLLFEPNLDRIPFEAFLKALVIRLKADKEAALQDNKKLANVLKKHGLYTSENIIGEV